MPSLSEEQISRAKQWDLLSYLQAFEPGELKKSGANEYATKSHDSLKISNGKWCWNSRGIGGKTALDYLIHVRGMGFVAAVEALTGGFMPAYTNPPTIPKEAPRKPFCLPKAARCAAHVVSYLQGRGIHPDIISHCIGAGLLYESQRYQNCVFVGKDPAGAARYASLRGTSDRFRIDIEGSEKQYGFCIPAALPSSPFLAVCESPIDTLSLASILRLQGEDWTRSHYLSLGGTTPRALLQYLHDHPQITHISLCLDNDKAGLDGMARLTDAVLADPVLAKRIALIYPNPPPLEHGKDYNELLQAKVSTERCKNYISAER